MSCRWSKYFFILLQMLKGFPTPVRWSSLEKRSMHHWKRTANRNTQSSREGKCPQQSQAWHALVFHSTAFILHCKIVKNHWCNIYRVKLNDVVFAPCRFAKLLLRLPALRSIGLKCLEHLFFFKLIGDTPIDTFLMEMLEAPHQLS